MSYVVAFTGHRPEKLGGYDDLNPIRDELQARLAIRLNALVEAQSKNPRRVLGAPPVRCISGMALGFDQWAAEVCIRLGIPFLAAVPFIGQERRWPTRAQHHYRGLIERSSGVHVVCAGGYAPWKMQKRNVWMVDHCNLLIAAWDQSAGGTANCVHYAVEVERDWENLLP